MESRGVAHDIEAVPRTEDVRLKELAPFSKMLIKKSVRKGLHQAGFLYPTVIQATAIPVGKSGMDLLVQSKSGTGKTLIFCSVILDSYKQEVSEPQSLVIAPTREVAVQISQVLNEIGKFCPDFKAVCVIGGLNVAEDRKHVQGAKAIVGTPGRILHLIQSDVLNVSQIRILVLDEADKMYSKNFRQDIEQIRKCLPNRKQIIACSATFENNLDESLAKIMKNPLLVSTEERATLLLGIKQFVYELPEQKTTILEMQLKLDAVRHIFGRVSFKQCIIFAGSQSRAESYCNYLQKDGWPCELISGGQDQKTRLEQFRKFKEFKTRILLATDLMSRGVDSEHVNMVINLELPTDSVTYLHRIGRAGRFGSQGLAISFVSSEKDRLTFKKLMSEIGTGMQALNFPTKAIGERRDVWNFDSFKDDIECFGIYLSQPTPKAPLASNEINSLTVSLSENKENLTTNNSSSLQQSSINTNTFLINSNDSAVAVPKLNDFSQLTDKNPKNGHITPSQLQTDNPSTQNESLCDSSQQLLTSNTIDDASSIAADSLRSSQQDVSRYLSVLMQKSAIPTLVEFLVDHQSSQDTQTKKNQNLFDAYTEEVLNDDNEVSENDVTVDGPVLTSTKLAQLKSMLIDKPQQAAATKNKIDLYSDFASFIEGESSISASKDINKLTFVYPLKNVNNNSSDLYPATDEITVTTESNEANEEPLHFPSPAHNCVPNIPGLANCMTDQSNQQPQPQPTQILSINVAAHMEIPPRPSLPNSVPHPNNGMENCVEVSTSQSDSSESNRSIDGEAMQQSASEIESVGGNSSGFDEKTTTSASSGIVTSEHDINIFQRRMEEYETSSEDDYEDDDENDETYHEDNSGSENYYNTDEDDSDSEEEHYDSIETETQSGEVLYQRPMVHRISTSPSDKSHTSAYQSAYSRWVTLYWDQINLIQNYVHLYASSRP